MASAKQRFRLAMLALVLALVTSSWVHFAVEPPRIAASETSGSRNGDVALYTQIAERVRRGESYYTAAVAEHRARGYPLRPFYAVRLPSLAWLLATLPPWAPVPLAWVLLGFAIFAWNNKLKSQTTAERIAGLLLLTISGAPLISPIAAHMQEFWCGLLLTIALALGSREQWGWRLLAVALAVAVREFAAAFLVILLAVAVLERNWRKALWTAAVLAAAAALIAVHRSLVLEATTSSDPVSVGWLGLRGAASIARDLRAYSWLSILPGWAVVPAAFLPLLGWSELAKKDPVPLLWFLGFLPLLAIFARVDNQYWVVVLLPAYLVGLAGVPRFLRELIHSGPPLERRSQCRHARHTHSPGGDHAYGGLTRSPSPSDRCM